MSIKKYIIFTGVIIYYLFSINEIYANSCEYTKQIEECTQANLDGNTKSIEKFICINGTPEKRIYQIVLDQEFKKLDNEMDKFIEDLETQKNLYFGIDKQKTYIDGVNDISLKKKYFNKEYTNLCSTIIISKAASCMNGGITSIGNAINFFSDDGTSCNKLIKIKLDIFDDIAFSVLMFNKLQVRLDEKKVYDQIQRKDYDRLLNIMMINIGYLERIWQKWPTKLANPYGT